MVSSTVRNRIAGYTMDTQLKKELLYRMKIAGEIERLINNAIGHAEELGMAKEGHENEWGFTTISVDLPENVMASLNCGKRVEMRHYSKQVTSQHWKYYQTVRNEENGLLFVSLRESDIFCGFHPTYVLDIVSQTESILRGRAEWEKRKEELREIASRCKRYSLSVSDYRDPQFTDREIEFLESEGLL